LVTAEMLGLTFPLVGWETQAVQFAKDVCMNWRQWLSHDASVRSVTTFAAQGASGTGKTRLGRDLAQLIRSTLPKLEAPFDAPPDLIAAVEQCVKRGLTLRFDFKQHPRERKPDDIRAADLLWEAYIGLLPELPFEWRGWHPPSLDHLFGAISAIERRLEPYKGAHCRGGAPGRVPGAVAHAAGRADLPRARPLLFKRQAHTPNFPRACLQHSCSPCTPEWHFPHRSFTSRASTSCRLYRLALLPSPSPSRCRSTRKSTTPPSASRSLASHRRAR